MRLKQLHIRNIASIEKADIDFENGLNEMTTGERANIFLITGDTGAGKSVILDSITLALYGNSPRLKEKNVSTASRTKSESTAIAKDKTRNRFLDSNGEEIGIYDIRQYTRIGISASDDCYSEVLFEGNDGRDYRCRLSLGLKEEKKGRGKNKVVILKQRDPEWIVSIDGGGEEKVDKTNGEPILSAVGINFEQFSRMSMLAQGQFAAFLTGKKEERERILERLTNTEIFSRYGELISDIFKETKQDAEHAKMQVSLQQGHTMGKEEYELESSTLERNRKRLKELEEELPEMTTLLENLNRFRELTKSEKTLLEEKKIISEKESGEEHKSASQLVNDWKNTEKERGILSNLMEAERNEPKFRKERELLKNEFKSLYADYLFRISSLNSLEKGVAEENRWLGEREGMKPIAENIQLISVTLDTYHISSKDISDNRKTLDSEKLNNDSLKRASDAASLDYDEKEKSYKAKLAEIEAIDKEIEFLAPDNISDQKSRLENRKSLLSDYKRSADDLSTARTQEEEYAVEITRKVKENSGLKDKYEEADANFRNARQEYEKSNERLLTMRQSLEETLSTLRLRMREEKIEVCPLCGQSISELHDEAFFNETLSPLAKECDDLKQRQSELHKISEKAKGVFDRSTGEIVQLKKNLEKIKKDNDNRESELIKMVSQSIDPELPTVKVEFDRLISAIDPEIKRIDSEVSVIEITLKRVSDLRRVRKELDSERTRLEEDKNRSLKLKGTAESEYKTSSQKIINLSANIDKDLEKRNSAEATLTPFISLQYPEWRELPEIKKDLKKDAEEYRSHEENLKKGKDNRDLQRRVLKNIEATLSGIESFKSESLREDDGTVPSEYRGNVELAWTNLVTSLSANDTHLSTTGDVVKECNRKLSLYFRESGKERKFLESLSGRGDEVTEAENLIKKSEEEKTANRVRLEEVRKELESVGKIIPSDENGEVPEIGKVTEEANRLATEKAVLMDAISRSDQRLESHRQNAEVLKIYQQEYDEKLKRKDLWNRVNKYFGGTKFRRRVQNYVLRPLLGNANLYLERITDRYHLTCSESNDELLILVEDRYNKNQLRSATLLSGGERFMVSLALSLALSSLNRPDMNVDILFIDEGFGTLDDRSLDSVMATLERLQEIAGQSGRRVGVISHRTELEERITTQIRVTKKGEGRSQVEITGETQQTDTSI